MASMLDSLARKLGLRTDPVIFFSAAGLMIVILLVLIAFPAGTNDVFGD
jgi:choline/glycine/proline betaine transport protein